jgi:hypothetical protein
MQTSSLQSVSSALLRSAEQNVGVTANLLKKAMNSDKNLVATLLPAAPPSGGLDIRA